MFEKLFYVLWHLVFGAVILGVALNFMGLLPAALVAALAYVILAIAGVWLLALLRRLLVP